jgi:hypothetical protein
MVVDAIKVDHQIQMCIFCSKRNDLTVEHVLPRWTFGHSEKKNFSTSINGLSQSYMKTTVPACRECNSELLGKLEDTIERQLSLFKGDFSIYSPEFLEKLILWLQIIEYKFQVLDLRRRFLRLVDGQYLHGLANIPIAMMPADNSPSRVFTNLRFALRQISKKSKIIYLNSLVAYKTSNESFHFYHRTNQFVFMELPQKQIAFVFFFSRRFRTKKAASNAAQEVLKIAYE